MKCPKCKGNMDSMQYDGTTNFVCVKCNRVVWLDGNTLTIDVLEMKNNIGKVKRQSYY